MADGVYLSTKVLSGCTWSTGAHVELFCVFGIRLCVCVNVGVLVQAVDRTVFVVCPMYSEFNSIAKRSPQGWSEALVKMRQKVINGESEMKTVLSKLLSTVARSADVLPPRIRTQMNTWHNKYATLVG